MRVKTYGGKFKVTNGRCKYFWNVRTKDVITTINTDVVLNATQRLAAAYLIGWLTIEQIMPLIKALYGFLGGTASTHKWNWVDTRDLDAAYRLLYFGGITHDGNGITGDGINGYVATNFLSNSVNFNSFHSSLYCKSFPNPSSLKTFLGVYATVPSNYRWSMNSGSFSSGINVTQTYMRLLSTNPRFLILNRTASNISYVLNNDILIGEQNVASFSIPNRNFFLFNRNIDSVITAIDPSLFMNATLNFVSLGDGLTRQEAAALAHIVTFYQRLLNRQ